MEPIDEYLLAVCNSDSLTVAKKIGLSQNGCDQLMDERRKDSRKYMLIFKSKLDGQILNYRIISEQEAREIEGPHMMTIIND